MESYVGAKMSRSLRITLRSGEVFVLRSFSEVPGDSSGSAANYVEAWSGEIVTAHNLSPKRAKLFVPGSGLDFFGEDVAEIREEETSHVLFSRTETEPSR